MSTTPPKRGGDGRGMSGANSGAWRAVPIVIILAIVAGVAAFWWWNNRYPASSLIVRPEQAASAPATPVAPVAPTSVASAPMQAESAVQYPVTPSSAAAVASSGIAAALDDLLGKKAVRTFLQVDDFARRFVATVDNLGRSYAPASVWPVNPAPGRFTVTKRSDGSTVISESNSRRYTTLILLAESVDTKKAVDLYIRMYPLLQHTYQDLGFPKGYFNDRLIQVIDLLLASPDPASPVEVQLTDVKGPQPSVMPWVRYEFADPALQSLTSGQKIMVRVGPANERRLKAKLRELRKELLSRSEEHTSELQSPLN